MPEEQTGWRFKEELLADLEECRAVQDNQTLLCSAARLGLEVLIDIRDALFVALKLGTFEFDEKDHPKVKREKRKP